jgi:hypothetical protein
MINHFNSARSSSALLDITHFVEAGYVDGIMDKEILERVKEREIQQERLWLI